MSVDLDCQTRARDSLTDSYISLRTVFYHSHVPSVCLHRFLAVNVCVLLPGLSVRTLAARRTDEEKEEEKNKHPLRLG